MRYTISKGDKKQITFYCSKNDFKQFQERYPNCATLFLSRCIKSAINDQGFFADVFFDTKLKSR